MIGFRIVVPRASATRNDVWIAAQRVGLAGIQIDGLVCTVPAHWIRTAHGEHTWGYDGIFAVHPDGPDERARYDGETERGYELDVWGY